MNAGDLYKAGKLSEAVDAQIKEVKANPGDHARRLFLFELLAFTGDIERVRRQIDAVKYDQPELEHAAAGYRQLLAAEEARRLFVGGGEAPQFLQDFTQPFAAGSFQQHLIAVFGFDARDGGGSGLSSPATCVGRRRCALAPRRQWAR